MEIHMKNRHASEYGMPYVHILHTKYVFYYGAFQNWKFPSSSCLFRQSRVVKGCNRLFKNFRQILFGKKKRSEEHT